jgi:microcystin-dependent protein
MTTNIKNLSGDAYVSSNLVIATNKFYVDTVANRVGIGKTLPSSDLDVLGNLKTTNLTINNITDSYIPIGFIILWSGTIASIPTGWAICNGGTFTRSDGGGNITTPDLETEFLRSYGPSYQVHASGGSTNVTITEDDMPYHTHNSSTVSADGGHNHKQVLGYLDDSNFSSPNGQPPPGDGGADRQNYYIQARSSGHSHNATSPSVGNAVAFSKLPVYTQLAYIMKI